MGEEFVNFHVQDVQIDDPSFSTEKLYIEKDSYYEYGVFTAELFPNLCYVLKNIAGEISIEEEDDVNDTLVSIDNDFLSEIQGFADSLDLTNKQAIYLLGIFDKYFPTGECTISISTGDATWGDGDQDTFLSQNLDSNIYSAILHRFCAKHLWITKILGTYKIGMLGIPIFMEIPLINEEGLGFGGNGIAMNEDHSNDEIDSDRYGVSCYWLFRKCAREFDTVQEVADYIENADRAAGKGKMKDGKRLWPHHYDNMAFAWCDKNGDIVAIEQMANYFVAAYRDSLEITGSEEPDILWHTNHFLWNDTWDQENPDAVTSSRTEEDNPGTYKREKRIYELLNYYYGFLTNDVYKNSITSDHLKGEKNNTKDNWDICRHLISPPGSTGLTMIGWVTQPKDKTVWIIPNFPCKDTWIEHDYEDDFSSASSENQLVSKSYSAYPAGYYYQLGTIPYTLQTLKNSGYITEDLDDDEKTNLIILAVIADFLAMSDNLQLSHNFAMTRANTFFDQTDGSYLNCSTMPNTIVDAEVGADDPMNNTWTTIQKAIDNTSDLGIVIVNNGTYSENIEIDKSIILFGEDKNNVIINGSINMANPHDYELIGFGEDDSIQNVNMTGLELLYHFNNDTRVGENYSISSFVFDYSGEQHNGTKNNASHTTSTIKGTGAFVFNGANSSISLNSIPALTGNEVTVSAWINWQEGSETTDPLVSQRESSNGYMLYVNSAIDKPVFRLNDTETVSTEEIENGWHNIVGTYDGNYLKLYIDGICKGNESASWNGVDTDCYIGYDIVDGYFNGSIDEVSIWNRTLSDTEISHIYDQHYGVTMDSFTVQGSDSVGISVVNHTDLTNFIIKDHETGVKIDDVFDVRVSANFSNCNSGIEIKNCSFDEYNKIHLVDCNFAEMSNGVFLNSSDYVGVYRNYMDCTGIPMQINNCDINKINVVSSTSKDNVAPDTPSLSGSLVGERNTTYIYSAITNDTDDDQLWYYFDWGDGTNSSWIGPYHSGEQLSQSHTWLKKGIYTIKCKVKDIYNVESDWGILKVSMPRNKLFTNTYFYKLNEKHPQVIAILRHLIWTIK